MISAQLDMPETAPCRGAHQCRHLAGWEHPRHAVQEGEALPLLCAVLNRVSEVLRSEPGTGSVSHMRIPVVVQLLIRASAASCIAGPGWG